MKSNVLSNKRIALLNLKRKPMRAVCLIGLVSVLSFILFSGSILTASLKNGVNSMKERLGADIMIVPKGAQSDIEGILIGGKSSAFFFDNKILEKVASYNQVSHVSPQYFFTSLSADCCSIPVQLIGYDPKTDFVIQPWLSEEIGGVLTDGELVVGNDVEADEKGYIKFFNKNYKIIGRLDKTAIGFDSSVFMDMNTAHKMLEDLKNSGYSTLTENEDDISAVLVDVKEGYDINTVAKQIQSENKDTDVIVSKSMFTNISDSLNTFVSYIGVISTSIWILVVMVLFAVFTLTSNERKREFSIFRILGATRKKLVNIVLSEAAIISVIGSITGIVIASILVFPFNTYIGLKLQLPYLQPSLPDILLQYAISLLLSLVIGPLAAIVSAIKIGKLEAYTALREGE